MKFENTDVWGFEHAIRGMRNPLNSWDKSDSYNNYQIEYKEDGEEIHHSYYRIGANDMKLAQRLISGGSEHRKFLRQIFVSVDITAPLYWWKQADTYKIGTTANSTSTMHKLATTPITLDCFETDDLKGDLVYYSAPVLGYENYEVSNTINMFQDFMIEQLEFLRQKYIETKDKRYWKELVRWLPEGWLQTRTWTANYETIRTICHQRSEHKLNEWSGKDNPNLPNFIQWAKTLPYAKELIFYN